MKGQAQHSSLADGRWVTLSLAEQLCNIGSEVNRALRAGEDKERFDKATFRAFELFELTISDIRWRKRLKELTRAREFLCDAVLGGTEYGTTLEDLNKYFYYFAYAARVNR